MKNKTTRYLTVVLAIWMLIVSIPLTVFADLLNITVQPEMDEIVYVLAEDNTKRTEFEKHFYCSDGTFVAVTYPEAVHYQNEQGEWVDVDMRLASDNTAQAYESQSGNFKTTFSKPGTQSDASVMSAGAMSANVPAVNMQSGDYSLSWSLTGTKTMSVSAGTYALDAAIESGNTVLSASADAQVQVKGGMKTAQAAFSVSKIPVTNPNAFALPSASNQVIYEDIFGVAQNVSVRYSVSMNKIEEDILITAPTDITSFSMQVDCGALTPVLNDDNSVNFLDNQGQMVYHVSTPYLADAALAVSYDVAVALAEQDGTCTITYTPDAEWMNAPEREYPIMLDPAVTTNDYTASIMDTYVVRNDASGYYTSQFLSFNPMGQNERYAVLKIQNFPNIDPSMPIISAKLNVKSTTTQTSSAQVTLGTVQDGFNVLIGNYNALMPYLLDSQTIATTSLSMFMEFDITQSISDIYSGAIGNTFVLHCDTNGTSALVFPIHSMESTEIAARPYLTITYGYNLPAGLAANDEITIKNVGSAGYLYPNSGLSGNNNLVLHASESTTNSSYRLMTLRPNATNGTYKIEYTPFSNSGGAYISANTTNQKVVMYNTTNVPDNIKQDWLIVPYNTGSFKIVLASDMRYVLTAVGNPSSYISDPSTATSGYVSITLCTGTPTVRQRWKIYEDGVAKENNIASTDVIDNGYYYFNCSYLGYYLYTQEDTVDTVPGRVSELGSKIMWKISRYMDGYYLIQNATDESKLLTATGSGVEMANSNGTIDDSQKWTIMISTYGYLFSNAYYEDSSIETETSPYGMWRLKKCSEYVELGSFGFQDCTVGIGDSVVSSIDSVTPVDSGAVGAVDYASREHDFLYHSMNESIATVDERTGVIYGESRGVATIEVFHRVTGIRRTFDVTVEKKAIIVIPGLGGSELFVGKGNSFFKEGAPIINQEMLDVLTDLQDGLSIEQIATLVGGYVLIVPIPAVSMTAAAYGITFVNNFYDTLQCNDDGSSKHNVYTKKYVYTKRGADGSFTLPSNYDSEIYTPHAGLYNTYYNLLDALNSDESLTSKYSIEFFSYDWRLSNGYSAERLDAFIEENNYDKVILVAHSMGGLVAAGYMGLGTEQLNKVEKVCMISSPLEGAPEVVNAWANVDVSALLGDDYETAVNVLNNILPIVTLKQDPLQQLISNYQSIYEMIPNEDYFSGGEDLHSYVKYIEIEKRLGAQSHVTEVLCNDYDSAVSVISQFLPYYDSNLMNAAEEFHGSCHKYKQSSTENTDWKYFYVTEQNTTTWVDCVKTIGILGKETFEVLKSESPTGDGLVPEWSATIGSSDPVTKRYTGIWHNSIVKNRTTDILNFLKGEL